MDEQDYQVSQYEATVDLHLKNYDGCMVQHEELVVYGDQSRTEDSSFFNSAIMDLVNVDLRLEENPKRRGSPTSRIFDEPASVTKKKANKVKSRETSNADSKKSKSKAVKNKFTESNNCRSTKAVRTNAVTPVKLEGSKTRIGRTPTFNRENLDVSKTVSSAKQKVASTSIPISTFESGLTGTKTSKSTKENLQTFKMTSESNAQSSAKFKPASHLKDSDLFRKMIEINPRSTQTLGLTNQTAEKDKQISVTATKRSHNIYAVDTNEPKSAKNSRLNDITCKVGGLDGSKGSQQKLISNTMSDFLNSVQKANTSKLSEAHHVNHKTSKKQSILQRLSSFHSEEKDLVLARDRKKDPLKTVHMAEYLNRADMPGSLLNDFIAKQDGAKEKRRQLASNIDSLHAGSRSNSVEASLSGDVDKMLPHESIYEKATSTAGKSAYLMQTLDKVMSKSKKRNSKLSTQS